MRHDIHRQSGSVRATLVEFVMDNLWLLHWRWIPPLHLLNGVLQTGGSDLGTSPGTWWSTGKLSTDESERLVVDLCAVNREKLRSNRRARFIPGRIVVDHSLGNCRRFLAWLRKVRAAYA